jgi:hypothetical protein
MEIKSYKESMEISKEEKEYKISKYKLQIEVGDNNKDILVEDDIDRYHINNKYLISKK